MQRADDFQQRRGHLQGLTDAEVQQRFWDLAHQAVAPLVDMARTHTSPAIERSILLRMGFSSLEAGAIVERCVEQGILGQGAGRIVWELARAYNISIRDAGLGFAEGAIHRDAVARR